MGITTQKTSQNFVFGAAVTSDNNKYSTLVHEQLSGRVCAGCAEADPWRCGRYHLRRAQIFHAAVARSRSAWRAAALTAPDVVNALSEQNVEVAAGQVGQQPVGCRTAVSGKRAGGRATQRAGAVRKHHSQNEWRWHSGPAERRGTCRTGGRELCFRSAVQWAGCRRYRASLQLSTANALDVDRRAIAELDRLSKSFPPGMHYKLAFDTTDAVGESIRDVTFTVGSAIVLVILVIFIFLGDWRTTMIHFIATPVSLIGTFVFVKLLGFSINTLTLFGITLATGLVVDDAIVVIENIERHIAEGEHDSHKAAAAATAEITGAVIATSLVLVAVFVPVAFFPGTTGILFRQFALTIAFSIAISAFNALTLAPVLAAILSGESPRTKVVVAAKV